MIRYVEHLAGKIGPRGSTTRAERAAAQYIADELEAAADQVVVQPFRSVKTFSWAFGLHYLLMVLAALLMDSYPIGAALLATGNMIGYLRESSTREFFTRILPQDKSQNVIAVKSREGDKSLPRLVLVAHYDTSRSGLNFHPKLVAGFRTSYHLMNVSMAAILALTLAAALAASPGMMLPGFFRWLPLPFAFYLLGTVLLLLHREIWGVYVPGANDNASGVAVMLHSFKQLAQTLPPGAEVWAVATGCEEAGTVGMLRFLDEYGDQIRNDYILNLDNLGLGYIKYITGEGLLNTMPADRELVLAAAAFARKNPAARIAPHVYKSLTTDATPALIRGYKVMSIMAFAADGTLPNWHWPTDTVENINPENLATASRLVESIARQLWRQE